MVKRHVWLCAAALLVAAACQTQAPARTAQVLRISIERDVVTLDPTQLHQPSVEESLARNIFNGLYRFDNNLKEVPDLARGMPEVSTDQKTWTFRLRPDAKFGSGDPVTADDVIYSWNRNAQQHLDSAVVFEPVIGFDDVQSGKQTMLAGLSTPDPKTVVAHLSAPAGFWLVELGLWPTYVLNRTVLRDHGEKDWWKTPQYLNASATGPFQLSDWRPGLSLDFKPTQHWWRGSTGTLTGVHAEIVADPADAVTRYERSDLDVIGYAPDARVPPPMPVGTLQKYAADRNLASQVYHRPWLETLWLRFNTRSGPLAGAAGQAARMALSQAVDRKAFASAVCDGGLTCAPATGGMFVPGLQGYLGDNQDPNSVFDPIKATAAMRGWDPDGTKSRAIRLVTFSNHKTEAQEVHRQWMANLGIDVPVDVVDSPRPQSPITEGVFIADYDSPWNWFNAFVEAWNYSNPAFDALAITASAKLPSDAMPGYLRAQQILEDDVAFAALGYRLGVFLVKPTVIGAGGNALYEYYWTGIRIKSD